MVSNAFWHEKYIPGLKRWIKFCNECGEYWDEEYDECSNPFCPDDPEEL